MASTPDYYLTNVWVDKAAYLALAARTPRSAAVRARVVDLAQSPPDQFSGDEDVAGSQWLLAALAGDDLTTEDLTAIARHLLPLASDNPIRVVDRILTHPASAVEAVGGVLDALEWVAGCTASERTQTRHSILAVLDDAGHPATVAWRLATSPRHRCRDRGCAAGSAAGVLQTLAAEPHLIPAASRMVGHVAADVHQLLETVRAICAAVPDAS